MKTWYLLGLEEASWPEKLMFVVAMSVMLALGGFGFLKPSVLSSTLIGAKTWVLNYFGWWFILLGFVLLIVVLLLVFSQYGKLRIGGPDAEPEFGLFSWLSMVFTVGFGASILIWGVAEPISIVSSPPPKPYPVQGASVEAMALAFMFIHEVFPGLAMWYLPVAMAFGIIVYTDGVGEYKISSMLTAVIDEDRIPGLYWTVNLAAVIATIGGISTTLGFSAQTMAAILGRVFNLEATVLTYAVFALIGVVFLGDVWLGLRKGIRNAARVTMLLIGLSMALLVVVGPTVFMFELGLDATGVWLSEMFRLTLYTAPTSAGNWAANWTGFWWAWWAAWSIFVGSFVARVSKGRTIREMFVVLVVVPTFLTWIQHLLIGGWVLAPGYQQPVADIMAAAGKPAAIAKALQITSFGTVLAVLFVLVIAGYIITSLDSAVFMISAITLGDENPNPRNRAWWGALLAFFGMMSLELKEFSSIQSLSVTMALPFSLLLLVILYGSYVVAKGYVQNTSEIDVESETLLTRQSDSSTPSDD
ncbi:BCCT family transporter (plasmid) [Haloferax mediterranei ATCC 33500]|uniref:BCCT family transporter n=1 Tax=Haloferax mediterranei (strain ATCC 33500 / DSM 1411 / JCM 8866 / NBRC 14739 / NCIMB 2177 / R-4) TaxID=523841 RepID=I3RAE8_HALMT|nr:BCCT family transporter [Haloferax mediterranei]AFK21208.1 putative glycine betaine transport protein [Haloferax mediterranei ATCC 33500]AHZ24682.1 glycine/betaine ABC transporter [Haloferax mediterranei ATCC 33500]ELZ97458.1 putative glycine betaine transport protein [Haloferax mediterranei ATCC 33500]MDX5990251.1 BCCT family transporter [Haloferax mediterranei ATCC 33500]QCQ76682.1 BCCT family transporter [Haloferax mediterranei ATCC 33500]